MIVIVVAVITQVFRVPQKTRGDVKGLLWVNSGFFQAVGVISFGASKSTEPGSQEEFLADSLIYV